MTERLYYHDAFLKEFDARVISCEQSGERWKVVLDRTAFYPTSGGQPHDLGTLAGVPIVEVADAEDHTVVHYTDAAIELGPRYRSCSRQTLLPDATPLYLKLLAARVVADSAGAAGEAASKGTAIGAGSVGLSSF